MEVGPQVGEVTPPVHKISILFDHVYMIGGVTCHLLPHLHVNRS